LQNAWKLNSLTVPAANIDDVVSQSDFISLHIPLNEKTKNLFSKEHIARIKKGATLLNFSRAGVVDEAAIVEALNAGDLHFYVCDFPSPALINHPRAIALPHLGASTEEAEENCAVMVADQIRDFLEQGIIRNSVNFPEVAIPLTEDCVRITITNQNIPGVVGHVSSVLGDASINIVDLTNKSHTDVAYTLIDVSGDVPAEIVEKLRAVEGVLSVRII
jgi:D-3-phosphoglycerate dehydrogenase